jgi:hypothetical protein
MQLCQLLGNFVLSQVSYAALPVSLWQHFLNLSSVFVGELISVYLNFTEKLYNANVRNNHAMDMSLCHGGVLVEHKCVCESRRVRVRRVGACRTIVESGHEFVPPQPLVRRTI